MPIPAHFILTAESAYSLSPVASRCRKLLLKLHPNWKECFFSGYARREFIRKRRPELLELYDFYPRPVQQADFFRVVAVYELGGFYLDLDVHLFSPLDELRRGGLVLTEEWRMSEDIFRARHQREPADTRELFQIGNYGFGAAKGHWFLAEVIEEMIRRAEVVNASTCTADDVLFSTGPDVFSTVYHRHSVSLAHELILLRGRNDTPEPKGTFQGEPWWFQFGRYGNHLMSSSWR